jgi:hypothetical protein
VGHAPHPQLLKGYQHAIQAMLEGQSMDISFKKLTEPTEEIATTFERWNNDPVIYIPKKPTLPG